MPNILFSVLMSLLLVQTPSLDSTSPKERQEAVEQMAVIGNRAAIPVLAEARKKEARSDIRASMVAAFGRIGDREAIPAIVEAMHTDLDKDVRLQAIDSLLRLYIPIQDEGQLRTIFNRVKSVFFQADAPIVAPTVSVDAAATQGLATSMQKDFSDDVRVEAARALGSLRARDQIPTLIAALEDPQNREYPNVRIQITQTLGQLRDPAAGPTLEKLLADRSRPLVLEAITSIGLTGYTDARPALENLYRTSRDNATRRRSLESLSLLRDPANTPLFESLLTSPDNFSREIAAEGLARLDYDASSWKDRYTLEKQQNVRNAMAFALAASGQDEFINDLANQLDSRQDVQASVYLYELGKFEGKLPELHRYLRSTNPKVRIGMLRVLGDIGDASSRDHIQPLTQDASIEVVREAVAALRRLNL
jgi:HEAT repeat protein